MKRYEADGWHVVGKLCCMVKNQRVKYVLKDEGSEIRLYPVRGDIPCINKHALSIGYFRVLYSRGEIELLTAEELKERQKENDVLQDSEHS